MKKLLLFALASTVVFFGCLQQKDDVPSIEAAAKVRSGGAPGTESIAPGVVPSDIGLFEIALDPDHHTWKDLDDFYKNVV